MQPDLPFEQAFDWWRQVSRRDVRARRLVDGEVGTQGVPHYSRQTPGAADFMANGRTFVLLGRDDLSVWGAIENHDPVPPSLLAAYERGEYKPALKWRCSVFRRDPSSEGPRASDLVRAATELTYARWFRASWRARLGTIAVPLQTEINASRVRHKRDPGRCFLRAGWVEIGEKNGLVVLQASQADSAWRRP